MLSGFSKILASTAASVGKTVQSTVHDVTGPKALSEYEMKDQIGSGGPGMLWKLYRGVPVSDAKRAVMAEVCVWYLDKKELADERAKRGTSKAAEDSLLEIFRADAKVLQKLRHPGIVRVVEPLDESKWAMALVTEPISASVSNALGNLENMSSIPPELENLELGHLEIKQGLMQLSEALSFIHRNARLIHRGISPESIFITTNGGWKFAGFGFSVMVEEGAPTDEAAFMYPDFDVDHPVLPLQPPLDYTAPELTRPLPISARGGGLDARLSVDLFSLGLLTYHLLTKQPLLRCHNNLERYHSRVLQLRNLPLNNIPMDLEPELRRMLDVDPTARPTASEFASSRFFAEDMRLKALTFLDQMIGQGNDARAEFLNSLQGIWAGFDARVLKSKVLPPLLNELQNPATQLLALPWVLEVVEVQDSKDFQTRTQKLLVPAMEAAQGELLLLFLRHMPALISKATPELMTSHLLPMMMRAFEDADPRLQEETLRRSIALVPKLDFAVVKEAILPRIHMLALRTSVAAVRVQALASLGEMVPTLDKPAVMDILQTMARCASVDHSPPTLMCIVGVTDVIQKQYGMEFSAQHILPLLTPLLTVQQLTNAQFARMLKLIIDILTQLQDKRGVSLSEADSVSLDLASMGLGPANGDAPPSAAIEGRLDFSGIGSGSDGWGGAPPSSTPAPSGGSLAPSSDPFASVPPLATPSTTHSAPGSGTGALMGSSAPTTGILNPGSSLGVTSLGGPALTLGSSTPTSMPFSSASGAPLPDLFTSATASASAQPDPFAPSSAAPLGGTSAGTLGLASIGGGVPQGGAGYGTNLSSGAFQGGMAGLTPDKPPPDDDPFADWPPRKPNPPTASGTGSAGLRGLAGTSGLDGGWGAVQGNSLGLGLGPALNPGPIRAPQPTSGSSGSLLGSMSTAGAAIRPPPTPHMGFATFPPPPGNTSQQVFGDGFNNSPTLYPAGPARPPSDPFDLL